MNADELDALLDALPEPAAPPAPRPRHERLCEDSGVDAAPADGDAARAASLAISKRIAPPTAPTVPPLPHAQWERAREVAEKFWEKHQPAERVSKLFVDLPSSGIRVRAHRWGDFDDPHAARLLLLHDLAESGGGLCDLGTALASRGYAALAPDLRGHGDSDGNGDRRYALPALAGDLLGLVLELDLYARPFVICGFGLGAAIALVFAAKHPQLVAKLVLVDVGDDELRPFLEEEDDEDEVEEREERDGDARDHPHRRGVALAAAPSASPRDRPRVGTPRTNAWTFHPLQAATMDRPERLLECLRAPALGESAPRSSHLFGKILGRSNWWIHANPTGGFSLKIDPRWHLQTSARFFEEDAPSSGVSRGKAKGLAAILAKLRTRVAILRGDRAVPRGGAERLANTLRRGAGDAAPVIDVVLIPGAGARCLEEAPRALRASMLDATLEAEGRVFAADPRTRLPETLGLRPLEEFASAEEARRRLVPRPPPTPEDVADALAEARRGDEEASDEEEERAEGRGRTMLIKEDPEYFGFVG